MAGVHRYRFGPADAHQQHEQRSHRIEMHQRIEVEPSIIGGSGVPEGIAHPGMGVLMHRQEQQEHLPPG